MKIKKMLENAKIILKRELKRQQIIAMRSMYLDCFSYYGEDPEKLRETIRKCQKLLDDFDKKHEEKLDK